MPVPQNKLAKFTSRIPKSDLSFSRRCSSLLETKFLQVPFKPEESGDLRIFCAQEKESKL